MFLLITVQVQFESKIKILVKDRVYGEDLRSKTLIAKIWCNNQVSRRFGKYSFYYVQKLRKGLDTVESLSGVARGSISKIFLVLLEGPKIGLLQPNLNKIFRVL
jgi:hypothetical protein